METDNMNISYILIGIISVVLPPPFCRGGRVVQKQPPVELCGELDIDQSLAERVQPAHCVVGVLRPSL